MSKALKSGDSPVFCGFTAIIMGNPSEYFDLGLTDLTYDAYMQRNAKMRM